MTGHLVLGEVLAGVRAGQKGGVQPVPVLGPVHQQLQLTAQGGFGLLGLL